MDKLHNQSYMKGFFPYALAAFLIGIIGGFTTMLGTAFVKDIGIPYSNTTWTTLAMAVSSAACAPILGKFIDILGRRKTLLLGISIFTLGNLLTALANSLIFMLMARFIVGVGTAAVAPLVMSYIITEFPPQATARGFSLYMLISSGAVVFGPTLGGLVINTWGWRTMMWICVAICLAVLLACLIVRVTESHSPSSLHGFDFAGAALVFVFFSLLLCVPAFGQNIGWSSPSFFIILISAVVSLVILVFIERRAENPIISGPFIFRRAFVLTILALFLTQGLLQANTTNIIIFINHTQPDNYIFSSYAISIMYLGMSLGSVILGPLADKLDPKYVLTGSLLLTATGAGLMMLFGEATSIFLLASALGIMGFSLGANAAVFMKVVLSNVPEDVAGAGSGTYGLFRDLSAPFGVAVLVPFYANTLASYMMHGTSEATAAVNSIHTLSGIELICVAAGIVTVLLLPKVRK